jgi:outer membrane lipoprotein-sorting protein
MLLSGEGQLDGDYTVRALGRQGVLDWVSLITRAGKGNFSEIQLGFEGNTLRLIQLLDRMERVTRLTLSHVIENQPIDDSVFRFTPPAGVDIIDDSG